MAKATPELVAIEPVAPTPESITPAVDPFDLANLRLASNFAETAGVKKSSSGPGEEAE